MHVIHIYIYVYIKNTYYYLLYTWKTRVPWLEPFGMLAAECIPNSEISAFCGFFIAPAKSQCPCKKKTSAVKSHPLRGNDSRSQDVLTVIGSHRFPWLPKKNNKEDQTIMQLDLNIYTYLYLATCNDVGCHCHLQNEVVHNELYKTHGNQCLGQF